MAGLMDLLNSLRGGMPSQKMPAAPPMAMPGMDPKTQMTGFAPPVQVAPSKGLRGMFGLDDQVGQSGFSRGDMGALALSQFGSTYGRNAQGGNGGNQLIQTMVASKAKERQADSKRQQLAAQMRAAGYSEQDIVAVQFAPEQAIKAIYDRAAPYTLNQGDARFGPGGKLEANNPKFAYQNDTILQEGPGGVQNMGRLDPSFENIETERNNRQQNAIGWENAATAKADAGNNAYRSMTPAEIAEYGLPEGTAAQISGDGKVNILRKDRQYTEFAGKAAEFAYRMAGAEPTINKLEQLPTFKPEEIWSGFAFNNEAKNYRIGMREWIAALLRKDTGAAVTPQEFTMYGNTYFPVPGDGPQQIEAKRAARTRAIKGIQAASQGAYDEWFEGDKGGASDPLGIR